MEPVTFRPSLRFPLLQAVSRELKALTHRLLNLLGLHPSPQRRALATDGRAAGAEADAATADASETLPSEPRSQLQSSAASSISTRRVDRARLSQAHSSDWMVAAIEVTGAAHVARGQDCQDSASVSLTGTALVVVVCDGAGSATRSGEGARLFSRTVASELSDLIAVTARIDPSSWTDIALRCVERTRGMVEPDPSAGAEPHNDFAATLVAFACTREFTASLHIGDGLALAFDERGEALMASLPHTGEYANETFFVTDRDWRERVRCGFVPTPAFAILVCTDGAQGDLLQAENGSPNWSRAGALGRRLAHVGADAFTGWLAERLMAAERDEIADDDTTLVVATRLHSQSVVDAAL